MDLIEQDKLQAYRIADQFLRLKKIEVLDMRNTGSVASENVGFEYTFAERLKDFVYFNDFYMLSILFIIALIYVILFF